MQAPFRVLVALNDQNLSTFLQSEILRDPEWDLIGATPSGLSALKMTGAWLPDAVIMDAFLPGLDCAAFLQRLKDGTIEKLPFIAAMTAPALMGRAEALLEQGADALWAKQECARELSNFKKTVERQPLSKIAFMRIGERTELASKLLMQIGMNSALLGFAYLATSSAIASVNLELSKNLNGCVYRWVAHKYGTTPTLVERAIRHAIESTVNHASPQLLYAVFGNTMDPQRGKPTNSELIAMLAERVRLQSQNAGCADAQGTMG